MVTPQDIRDLAQSIVDSYEMRVKTVSALMKEAAEALRNFRVEQEEAIARLRDDLATNKSLRKKDFDSMIKGLLTRRADKEKEVSEVLEGFRSGGEETVAGLRRFLTDEGKVLRLEDFAHLKGDILARQEERERKAAEVLREFHREQEELNAALRKLLSKGESATIRDFRSTIRALKLQRQERENELGDMLKELERVHDEATAEWQRVIATTMGQRRGLTASPLSDRKVGEQELYSSLYKFLSQ